MIASVPGLESQCVIHKISREFDPTASTENNHMVEDKKQVGKLASSIPTPLAHAKLLISQSRGTHSPMTASHTPSHAPFCVLDSFATYSGHNIS